MGAIVKWVRRTVGAALAAVFGAWLMYFLSPPLPSPAQAIQAFMNSWRDYSQPPEDGFRIVVFWLENDSKGVDSRDVERAIGEIDGTTVVRSARILAVSDASEDWREYMQQHSRALLKEWNADLAIAGRVKEARKYLNLWFVSRSDKGRIRRRDQVYKLDKVTLGADFHDDFRAQLAIAALVAVAPLADTEVRGQVLEQGLRDATQKLSTLLNSPTIRRPRHLAVLRVAFGNALTTLGARDSGTKRFEQAVEAYQAAIEVLTRERVPLDWAMTQNNLGNALQALGERESGTERLEQAVEAYRAAIEVATRERVPLDWAMTQNNLGNALQALGERESGTERLEQAVEAYRAAIEVATRERVPLDWAMTQNNLGNALHALGKRESGTKRLEQAVEAYQAAIEVATRERVPLDWARIQNNLGNALQTLGERESGTERLERAVKAFQAALEVRTLERVPLQWAGTLTNLGNAQSTLGARERGTEHLEAAVSAFRAALTVLTHERKRYERPTFLSVR